MFISNFCLFPLLVKEGKEFAVHLRKPFNCLVSPVLYIKTRLSMGRNLQQLCENNLSTVATCSDLIMVEGFKLLLFIYTIFLLLTGQSILVALFQFLPILPHAYVCVLLTLLLRFCILGTRSKTKLKTLRGYY